MYDVTSFHFIKTKRDGRREGAERKDLPNNPHCSLLCGGVGAGVHREAFGYGFDHVLGFKT